MPEDSAATSTRQKREAMPPLPQEITETLRQYEGDLRDRSRLRAATVRNYLSDARLFLAWTLNSTLEVGTGRSDDVARSAATVTDASTQREASGATIKASTVTRYIEELQQVQHMRAATIRRSLLSICRYVSWTARDERFSGVTAQHIREIQDVRRRWRELTTPNPRARQGAKRNMPRLTDADVQSLLAAARDTGTPRDLAILTLLLETALRASDVCTLTREDGEVALRERRLFVPTARKSYTGRMTSLRREMPLSASAYAALASYVPTLPASIRPLFPSKKNGGYLTVRTLAYLLRKYTREAHLDDGVTLHDLRHYAVKRAAGSYSGLYDGTSYYHVPSERWAEQLLEPVTAATFQLGMPSYLKQAQFPYDKRLEDFDFSATPSVPKTHVLELAQGAFLTRHENVVLVGPTGVGKTHLLIGLGRSICVQGNRVLFRTATTLANELEVAQQQFRLPELLAQYREYALILIDELGYVPFSQSAAELLFQFFSDRDERASVALTSNLEVARWPEVFGNEQMTAALLDRLLNRSHILLPNGESYRLRQRVEQQALNLDEPRQ